MALALDDGRVLSNKTDGQLGLVERRVAVELRGHGCFLGCRAPPAFFAVARYAPRFRAGACVATSYGRPNECLPRRNSVNRLAAAVKLACGFKLLSRSEAAS